MARTDLESVQKIVHIPSEKEADIDGFIAPAAILVDRIEARDSTVDADVLAEIERWLTAHFLIVDTELGGLTRTATGDGSDTYARREGAGILATRYGEQAAALDPTGLLTELDKPKARFRVLKDPPRRRRRW